MKYHYMLIHSTLVGTDTAHTSYGIALVETYDDITIILQSVADLSTDKESVERLVTYCNMLQLEPVHLPDITDDFLACR